MGKIDKNVICCHRVGWLHVKLQLAWAGKEEWLFLCHWTWANKDYPTVPKFKSMWVITEQSGVKALWPHSISLITCYFSLACGKCVTSSICMMTDVTIKFFSVSVVRLLTLSHTVVTTVDSCLKVCFLMHVWVLMVWLHISHLSGCYEVTLNTATHWPPMLSVPDTSLTWKKIMTIKKNNPPEKNITLHEKKLF